MHELKSLGGLSLADGSGATIEVPRRRLALLALLAVGGVRGVSRERAVALLWPDNAPESGRHSLDQLLSLTRRQLGDDVFVGGDPLHLNPSVVSSDLGTFEAALAAGDPVAAVNAYGGPFLDGFYLNGAGEFERWAESERQRLAHTFRDALRRLAKAEMDRGDAAGAVAWWRRLAMSDPLASEGAIGLMRALAAAGDRPGAIRHARVYEALVVQQLEMPPDPSVVALVEELRRAPEPRAPMPAAGPGATAGAPLIDDADVPSIEPPIAAPVAPVTEPAPASKPRRRQLTWLGATVVAAGFVWWSLAALRRPADTCAGIGHSIAVLPFANSSGDPADEYLSDGLTDELIAGLQGNPGIRVAPRSSSFYYKNKGLPSRDVGRSLGVDCAVEGSLRREGDQIRVTAQLVDVSAGFSVWSALYTQQKRSALALQEQVAHSIADSVLARLGRGRLQASASRRMSRDSIAYDLYLQGRYFLKLRTDGSLARALDRFGAAIARDSTFAPAWAGLADCYALQVTWGSAVPREAFPLAKAAADHALKLDSTRAEVHTSLGLISLFYDRNWGEAKQHFERALELDPESADAHNFYAWYLESQNRADDAVREIQRAALIEPLSVIFTTRLGTMLARERSPAEAIPPLRRAIQLDSTDANPRIDIALVYSLLAQHDSALANLPPTPRHLGNFEGGIQVFVLARAGKTTAARDALAQLQRLQRTRYVSGEAMAVAFESLGDRDRALAELRRAVAEHSFLIFGARHNPVFRSLRDDRRFQAILATAGVP